VAVAADGSSEVDGGVAGVGEAVHAPAARASAVVAKAIRTPRELTSLIRQTYVDLRGPASHTRAPVQA
jgi:hypothetical protein